ncbi:hypothetical protein [Gulosibacter sp. 10]|uniref:hypothetical protein n=1 Tax=Gulosibacter sp. 10 TaxID=1255570 RepID=UPI00097F5D21|nr:hypothetical protein [Gulosibacter sp. 10]SJM60088.1 hypothetical protein FM112_06915 [Gulosibacter sp. 10]
MTNITLNPEAEQSTQKSRFNRGGVLAVGSLLTAGALAFAGGSVAQAWPGTQVPNGEYDIVALDSTGDLTSYDHENEQWYDYSTDEWYSVSNQLIPADHSAAGDTTGGGFRIDYPDADNVEITIDLVESENGGGLTISNVNDPNVDAEWSISENDPTDSQVLADNYHEHFDWEFGATGDYEISVTATDAASGVEIAQQDYRFTVN